MVQTGTSEICCWWQRCVCAWHCNGWQRRRWLVQHLFVSAVLVWCIFSAQQLAELFLIGFVQSSWKKCFLSNIMVCYGWIFLILGNLSPWVLLWRLLIQFRLVWNGYKPKEGLDLVGCSWMKMLLLQFLQTNKKPTKNSKQNQNKSKKIYHHQKNPQKTKQPHIQNAHAQQVLWRPKLKSIDFY